MSIFIITRGSYPVLVSLMESIVSFVTGCGWFWMIYQAIRYEERVKLYALLGLVPFMFLWYRFVRFPYRPKLVRVPPA